MHAQEPNPVQPQVPNPPQRPSIPQPNPQIQQPRPMTPNPAQNNEIELQKAIHASLQEHPKAVEKSEDELNKEIEQAMELSKTEVADPAFLKALEDSKRDQNPVDLDAKFEEDTKKAIELSEENRTDESDDEEIEQARAMSLETQEKPEEDQLAAEAASVALFNQLPVEKAITLKNRYEQAQNKVQFLVEILEKVTLDDLQELIDWSKTNENELERLNNTLESPRGTMEKLRFVRSLATTDTPWNEYSKMWNGTAALPKETVEIGLQIKSHAPLLSDQLEILNRMIEFQSHPNTFNLDAIEVKDGTFELDDEKLTLLLEYYQFPREWVISKEILKTPLQKLAAIYVLKEKTENLRRKVIKAVSGVPTFSGEGLSDFQSKVNAFKNQFEQKPSIPTKQELERISPFFVGEFTFKDIPYQNMVDDLVPLIESKADPKLQRAVWCLVAYQTAVNLKANMEKLLAPKSKD